MGGRDTTSRLLVVDLGADGISRAAEVDGWGSNIASVIFRFLGEEDVPP